MTNSKLPVRDVMVSPVITIGPEDTIKKAAAVMLKSGIGGLGVVKDSQPIGMLTERDFVGLMAHKKNAPELKVKQVMSKRLVTVSPDEGLMDVARLIVKTRKRKLPVMENNRLIGIITADDIVRIAPSEIETLRELTKIKSEAVSFRDENNTEGECESCGNYSEALKKIGESFICEDCAATEDSKE
ncbi:MAG: CBS domain-containing protein [archaeon]